MNDSPIDDAALRQAVTRAAERGAAAGVSDALVASTEAQRRSLRALDGGAAVVTGQQVGLFGGPLYTLHKAAAAIVDAREIERRTGVPCAPVFWLQNEDHDFDEIASITVDGADGLVTLRIDGDPDAAGCSVRYHRLGASVDTALDALADVIDGLPHAAQVEGLLRAHYRPDQTVSQAFRGWLDALFAPHGLLVLDPGHPALAGTAAQVHRRAIDYAGPIADALEQRADQLIAQGRPAPVHVRPGAPLSFFHPDGADRPRFRVEPDGERYRLVGDPRTVDRERLAAGPHSTSALLRPILQDALLPTAMYVGGPGELAYLAQLPPLWAAFDLPQPLLVPRARFLLVDAPARRLLRQLGLTPASLDAPRDALLTELGRAGDGRTDPDALFAALTGGLADLQRFRDEAEAVEANLARAVDKTAGSIEHAATRLVDRYRRALARRDQVVVDRLDRLLAALRPAGAPQERVHGWAAFGARVGSEALVQRLIDHVRPFDGALREVEL